MKFEEALALMREGKIVLDPYGQEVTLENGKFIRPTYMDNPIVKGCVTQFSDKYILEEWTIKEEPRYEWAYGNGTKIYFYSMDHSTVEEAERERLRHECEWKHRIDETKEY